MSRYPEITDILNRQVRTAQAELTRTRSRLDALILQPPGEIAQPDGYHRIQIASDEHRRALNALEVALKRNVDFTLYGIIPEDLKDKISK